jgi:hypothetical protein
MINARISGVVVEEPQFSHSVHEKVYYRFVMESKRGSGVVDYIDVVTPKMSIVMPSIGNRVIVQGDLRSFVSEENKTCPYVYARFIENYTDPYDVNEVSGDGIIFAKRELRTTAKNNNPIIDFLMKSERPHGLTSVSAVAWYQWSGVVDNMEVGTGVEFRGRFQSREYKKATEDGTLVSKTVHEIAISEIKAKEE